MQTAIPGNGTPTSNPSRIRPGKVTREAILACLCLGIAVGIASQLRAEAIIDGASSRLWNPCVGWVTKAPARYGVSNDNGLLVFQAEGAGTEMPWIADLAGLGVSGDERYLLVRYQATGMAASPNIYFLHGEEGSHGGRTYATADALKLDGQWHTLAVDLVPIEPLETTRHLAIKVFVAESGTARLTIDKIRFTDELPADARIAPVPPQRPSETVIVDWAQTDEPAPQPAWTSSPASDCEARRDGSAMTFAVRGKGQQMRWILSLAKPIDLGRTPHLSVRYRASGQIAPTSYALWFGNAASGGERKAIAPVSTGDLKTDGAWHHLLLKLSETFTATQLAVGLDCAGEEASVTFDKLYFTSRPRRWDLADVLEYESLGQPWPAGKDGYVAGGVEVAGGKPSPFFSQRLDLAGWFDADTVAVGGVPFFVEREPGRMPQSPLAGFGSLSLRLPAGVREVYLLTAAAAPSSEPWGIEWARPKPQEMLDVPEKVFYEIQYESGPPERVLPLDAATGQWGMKRGLSVSVVHPDPDRRAVALALHDRMQTASFAIAAATMRTDRARIAEPSWDALGSGLSPTSGSPSLPAAQSAAAHEPVVVAGGLRASFNTQQGLAWSQLDLPGIAEGLACSQGPLFEVSVSGRVLPNESWSVEPVQQAGAARRFVLRHRETGLAAAVDCLPGKGSQILLRMKLTNEGQAATTASIRFPMLGGLRLGTAADTWYLSGKRGGIIHSANVSLRDPLGEPHPLQMDGFFNPKLGLALACLTRDTAAQHHFIELAKTGAGGEWSIQYVDRDLARGAAFVATEAALTVRPGDWRAIFSEYTDWLATWYRPVSPKKDWFAGIFATAAANVHYDACAEPAERSALEPLVERMLHYVGRCDSVHLFGWGASKTYGDWGDYGHYEEIGGQERFRSNIKAMQDKGIAVSLYLDAYLHSDKGQYAGANARGWAMKRPDGSPQYVETYSAYNQCPYQEGWQDYLSRTYRRVRDDLGPKILYIDEYGSTDGRWTCYAKDHGHNGHEIPYAGEAAMLRRIREAVGPEVALYTEYPPAEVSRQYLDGSITYQALWSADQEPLAPHFIDLPRFAFPDFKQFHIIYYVANRAGNWWLLKFPFFNGEVYRIGVPNLAGMDEPSLEFLKRAVKIQCEHREAFTSREVRPLVPTEASGVFANLFAAARQRVWTLYNANGRSVRSPVLRVPHVEGTAYEDVWNGRAVTPEVKDGQARIAVELDPKGVGCLVQRLP